MSSSHPQSPARVTTPSPAKVTRSFLPTTKVTLSEQIEAAVPGSMNDAAMIRAVVADAMKSSGLSRIQIAEAMSRLTGGNVTERQLNNFAADSREEYRFPVELARSFCTATGDARLITCLAELAGLYVVDEVGQRLLELGREYLREKEAAANKASLEARLRGVDLG